MGKIPKEQRTKKYAKYCLHLHRQAQATRAQDVAEEVDMVNEALAEIEFDNHAIVDAVNDAIVDSVNDAIHCDHHDNQDEHVVLPKVTMSCHYLQRMWMISEHSSLQEIPFLGPRRVSEHFSPEKIPFWGSSYSFFLRTFLYGGNTLSQGLL